MKGARSLNIGTSGWQYPHWGDFYPEDLPSGDLLVFYSSQLKTVEINNSFYRLPSKKALRGWLSQVPRKFIFSLKASRYITHMKKLKEPKTSYRKFFDRVEELGDQLGPILFQFPPWWRCNVKRLERFLEALPSDFRYTFEFREPSWFTEEVYELLERHRAAFCLYELKGVAAPEVLTANFTYVRLHGPKQQAYRGSYGKRSLQKWARKLKRWRREGRGVYLYFDNDEKAFAARNALELAELLGAD